MTYQNNAEQAELTLEPVDGEVGGKHSPNQQGYDGGFSLLTSKKPGINDGRTQIRSRTKRDVFQEFTCG